jgi:hypothetical protein
MDGPTKLSCSGWVSYQCDVLPSRAVGLSDEPGLTGTSCDESIVNFSRPFDRSKAG